MDDKKFELYFKNFLVPSLSKEEELDCTVTIYTSDDLQEKEECVKKLLRVTLRTVFNLARHYKGKGISLEELVSEGYNGLFKALDRFDPFYEPQTRFATFAYFYIKDNILGLFRENKKIHRCSTLKPSLWELVQDSDVSNVDLNQEVVSLTALSKVPDFEQKFGIVGPKTPEDEIVEKTNEEYLISCLKELLDPRELEIAVSLIGFKYSNYENLTPKELASKLDISETRVYQLRKEIGKKLVAGGLIKRRKEGSKVLWK